MTINNQIRLLDLNVNTQMVVQGWEISDYLENLDKIREQGLLTERLGIGSVCRRGQSGQIARIIRSVKQNVPSWVKLHGFGIKISVIKSTDAKFHLHSSDSQSWDYEHRYRDWLKGKYNGKTWIDKVPDLQHYISRMETLLNPVEQLIVEVIK